MHCLQSSQQERHLRASVAIGGARHLIVIQRYVVRETRMLSACVCDSFHALCLGCVCFPLQVAALLCQSSRGPCPVKSRLEKHARAMPVAGICFGALPPVPIALCGGHNCSLVPRCRSCGGGDSVVGGCARSMFYLTSSLPLQVSERESQNIEEQGYCRFASQLSSASPFLPFLHRRSWATSPRSPRHEEYAAFLLNQPSAMG